MAWLLSATAAAAPTFTGDPADVALALRAWDAAEACAGRDGSATEQVEVVRKVLPGDYLGVARTDASGALWRIDLNTGADGARHREVVVHEVTHAWISEGPVALVEGAAELLADCIARRVPGLAPLQYDDGRDLVGLPDLRAWEKPQDGVPTELYAVRTEGYIGAARLLRTAERAAAPGALWATRELGWDSLALALDNERGHTLLAALAGGAEAQRVALADADRDGLTALAESWLGTSDQAFDTDGDGWWDGAEAPAGAVPLPSDATPVCAAPKPARGGDLRGARIPGVVVREVWPGGPTLAAFAWSPSAESVGGAWVTGGQRAGCVSSRVATVWAEDRAHEALVAPVSAAVERALAEAAARFGPGPQRVAVALGGSWTGFRHEVVWLSSADVARSDADAIARLAVGVRRLWGEGEASWPAAEAMARALVSPSG